MNKRLGVLIAILAVIAAAGLVYYVPKFQTQNRVDSFQQRQLIGGALKQAAREYRRKNPEWPKSLEQIKDMPQLKPFANDLKSVKFVLVKVEKDAPTYDWELNGKKQRAMFLGSHNMKQGNPSRGGAASAGG